MKTRTLGVCTGTPEKCKCLFNGSTYGVHGIMDSKCTWENYI